MEEIVHLWLTAHAQERCDLRGISLEMVSIMYEYGKRKRTRDGFSYSMNQAARRRVKANLDELTYKRVADKLDFYIVVAADDGVTVITVAHRLKRHKAA